MYINKPNLGAKKSGQAVKSVQTDPALSEFYPIQEQVIFWDIGTPGSSPSIQESVRYTKRFTNKMLILQEFYDKMSK